MAYNPNPYLLLAGQRFMVSSHLLGMLSLLPVPVGEIPAMVESRGAELR